MHNKTINPYKVITSITIRSSIIFFVLFISSAWASGGYDHGTATGKGKFQIDLTWNPQDRLKYGQTYAVIGFGITNRLDLHGYVAHHTEGFETWYAGFFYQFLDRKRLDLATAIGIRRRFDENWTHMFFPQLLYTIYASENIYLGGSIVNLKNGMFWKSGKSMGVAIDFALFFKIQYQSNLIENIAVGFGGFRPATFKPDSYFLPTYSIDIKFKRFYKSK